MGRGFRNDIDEFKAIEVGCLGGYRITGSDRRVGSSNPEVVNASIDMAENQTEPVKVSLHSPYVWRIDFNILRTSNSGHRKPNETYEVRVRQEGHQCSGRITVVN